MMTGRARIWGRSQVCSESLSPSSGDVVRNWATKLTPLSPSPPFFSFSRSPLADGTTCQNDAITWSGGTVDTDYASVLAPSSSSSFAAAVASSSWAAPTTSVAATTTTESWSSPAWSSTSATTIAWTSFSSAAYSSSAPSSSAAAPRTVDLLLCGYSFGALAASSCPPPLPTSVCAVRTSYLLISYPLSVTWALTFLQSGPFTKALRDLVQRGENRVLAIFGDQDQFSAVAKLRAWAKGLEEVEGSEGRWSAVEVSGADHFWRDRRTKGALLEEVGRWLLSDDEEETAAPP